MPADYNLSIYRGDTFTQTLPVILDSTGQPISLAGTWTAQVRQDDNASTILATFAVDTTAGGGVVTISLDALTTAALTIGGVWDLQQVDQTGLISHTWYEGTVALTDDVTR